MTSRSRYGHLRLLIAALIGVALVIMLGGCAGTAVAPTATATGAAISGPTAPKGMATVHADQLPGGAQHTLDLIAAGGPFPYSQDGTVFQNREKLLPKEASGYYREYTVVTPGSSDRGARRIVAGSQGERYYTNDHYDSFRWVAP